MSQARARARSSSAARVVAWAFGIAARPHTKCRHGARGGPRPPPRWAISGRQAVRTRRSRRSRSPIRWPGPPSSRAWCTCSTRGSPGGLIVRVAMAAGVGAGESLIFAANRFRCPLTSSPSASAPSRARSPTSTYPGGSPTTFPPSTRRSSPSRPSSMDETSASRDAGTGGQDASEAIASGRRRLLAAGVAAAGLAARYAVGRARVDRAK